MRRPTVRTSITWLLQGILALAFVAIGLAKFGSQLWIDNFAQWGYPDWFRLVIGVVEVASGLALLWHRSLRLGLATIVIIMIGATATHLRSGDGEMHLTGPIVYTVLASAIWLLRGLGRPWRTSRQVIGNQ